MSINKRDLIRFVGDRLFDYYKRNVITLTPTYDTTIIHDDTDLSKAIKEFFIQPYYDLLEYRDSLPEGSLDKMAFEQRHPKLEYEVGEVISIVSAAIREYLSLNQQAENEKDALSRLHIDEATRAAIQETLQQFGRVTDGRRKN